MTDLEDILRTSRATLTSSYERIECTTSGVAASLQQLAYASERIHNSRKRLNGATQEAEPFSWLRSNGHNGKARKPIAAGDSNGSLRV